jgi:cytochrome c-type biogenesis protein CcmF
MLLWVTVLAVAGAVVALFERSWMGAPWAQRSVRRRPWAGFFGLLFASNPFERLDPAPLDGRGSTRC